jgi:hypothetical protein
MLAVWIIEAPLTWSGQRRQRGWFNVSLFGLGLGAGMVFPGEPIKFETKLNRRIEAFEGIGSIASAEYAKYIAAYGIMKIYLPDGTEVPTQKGLSGALSVGFGIYWTTAIWEMRFKDDIYSRP